MPLIALPSSPGNVVPVHEVAGRDIYQSMIGSSANPGLRDFAISGLIVAGQQVHERVSFDINPTSRQILENLIEMGILEKLVRAGGRIHQSGCNGCIGMGQAPATGRISLRTVPRNFPGRSGTMEDQVYLCSPETASASALMGKITDPRTLAMSYPQFKEPRKILINLKMLMEPPKEFKGELVKGPNIKPLPEFGKLPSRLEGPLLLKVGDGISTDTILPAGARVLPYRSNIPEISRFLFYQIDNSYHDRALMYQKTGSFIVGGENYGQGSSREHAALAPRYLGVGAVIVKSFARIHAQNLANFGILPLIFNDPKDYDKLQLNDVLVLENLRDNLVPGKALSLFNKTQNETYMLKHQLSVRQIEEILAGGLINIARQGQ